MRRIYDTFLLFCVAFHIACKKEQFFISSIHMIGPILFVYNNYNVLQNSSSNTNANSKIENYFFRFSGFKYNRASEIRFQFSNSFTSDNI